MEKTVAGEFLWVIVCVQQALLELGDELARGVPSSQVDRGDSGACSKYLNSDLRAETVHVCAPGALAMEMATPFLKGSVFDEGTVSIAYEGVEIDGTKSM